MTRPTHERQPRRRLTADERRRAILTAAQDVFAVRGYHGSSIDEIAPEDPAALVGVSFLFAWLTIGYAYRGPGGQPPPRNPVLGAVISLGAAAPAVIAIAWMVVDTFLR